MIVSFRHGFVFVAIPKTGSQAMRVGLRPLLAANDWEQCTLLERRFFPVEPLAALGHGHIEWRELEPYLLGRLDGMTSFAVVRDPYQRFASYARFVFRDEGALPPDYLARLKSQLSDPAKRDHILLREQHRFVTDNAGKLRATILRHENLGADLAALGEQLDLTIPELPPVNVSTAGTAFAFDDELRELIRTRYAVDFELFGYDPQGAGS